MEKDIKTLKEEVINLQHKLLKFLDKKIEIERDIISEQLTIKDNEYENIDAYIELFSEEAEIQYELWDVREKLAMRDLSIIKSISKSKRKAIRKSISKKSPFYDFKFPDKYLKHVEKFEDYYNQKSFDYSDIVYDLNKKAYAEKNYTTLFESEEISHYSDIECLYQDLAHQMDLITESN